MERGRGKGRGVYWVKSSKVNTEGLPTLLSLDKDNAGDGRVAILAALKANGWDHLPEGLPWWLPSCLELLLI